ncbi:MAG TPA: response regulator [Desulfurivibrio alkaliphilus]|uniref:Response regulator n=1 Tax=Desulfurivibrio alkaliphilus TaxID=427923 RepID=A0A7C2TH14_9BACT|nr:response regulator [Desulfurivibrio alkaliphilus]
MKILLVEDDFISRTVLQEILAPFGICHQAVDGREALKAHRRALNEGSPYNLICLDIMMPNLDGQETLRRIRELEKEQGIGGSDMVKVIMTTALDDPKSIMTALVKGSCEGYLVKPIRRDTLLAKLRELGMIQE